MPGRTRRPRAPAPTRRPQRQRPRQPQRAPTPKKAVERTGTRTPSRTRPGGGRDGGGTFTGPTSDMGPTVHVPDHLMPFEPTTMFA